VEGDPRALRADQETAIDRGTRARSERTGFDDRARLIIVRVIDEIDEEWQLGDDRIVSTLSRQFRRRVARPTCPDADCPRSAETTTESVKSRPCQRQAEIRLRHALTPTRQPVTARWRRPLTGSRFYTASTQRIPQRSRLRRRFVPASPIACRRGSNDSSRLDRRGELLLRMVRVDRLCDLWDRIRTGGSRRIARSGHHPGIDRRRNGYSADGESSAAIEGRSVPCVPSARVAVHPASSEARHAAARQNGRFLISTSALSEPCCSSPRPRRCNRMRLSVSPRDTCFRHRGARPSQRPQLARLSVARSILSLDLAANRR
jgi:hypothetical protein